MLRLGYFFLYFFIFGSAIIEFPVLSFYALSSLYRMLLAYLISLAFSISYGYLAATNKKAEKVMLPVLDVLQSVPVLGFFPAAVLFFISLFQGSIIGVELAAIFLIFTGQAWNMAFGVYESITTIPKDLNSAVDSFGVTGIRKFAKLIFPACIPKLVYNSIMSWAGGWYFLIACEIITTGSDSYKLPGIGSFLMESSIKGDLNALLIGLAILIFIIVVLDLFVWRPLSIWSENFKYEYTGVSERKTSASPLLSMISRISYYWLQILEAIGSLSTQISRAISKHKGVLRVVRIVVYFLFLAIVVGAIGYAALKLLPVFTEPFPSDAYLIPQAILFSMARLLVAYLLCLSWTLPIAVFIAKHERALKYLTPVIEIAASIPAVALFPLIVLLLIRFTGTMDIPAIILILTGMQWYLLFNLIAGVKSIPADIEEAACSFGVKKWLYWKRILLPGIYPSFITGSITAWGGGWNALIVSEFIVFGGQTYYAFGIGYLLSKSTFIDPNPRMIIISVIGMIITIFLVNKFIWRSLYKKAEMKYKIEM
jgi:NitT/TauT family transport system permease protein